MFLLSVSFFLFVLLKTNIMKNEYCNVKNENGASAPLTSAPLSDRCTQ